MKLGFLVLGLFFATSMAAKAETLYYVGEAITTTGSEVVRHPYCVARTSDLIAGTITEKVVSYEKSGYAENSSVMKIENNHFTMTVSSGSVTGVGDLTGTP